jgi:hypothetical protein
VAKGKNIRLHPTIPFIHLLCMYICLCNDERVQSIRRRILKRQCHRTWQCHFSSDEIPCHAHGRCSKYVQGTEPSRYGDNNSKAIMPVRDDALELASIATFIRAAIGRRRSSRRTLQPCRVFVCRCAAKLCVPPQYIFRLEMIEQYCRDAHQSMRTSAKNHNELVCIEFFLH